MKQGKKKIAYRTLPIISTTALQVSEKTPRYLSLVLTSSTAVASIQGIITEDPLVNGSLMGSFLRTSFVCRVLWIEW